MDYKKINDKLGNLQDLRNSQKAVHKNIVHEIDSGNEYPSQGGSNESYEVYDIGLPDGLFVELKIGSDSYGDNDTIDGIRFVQAVEKTIKVYEYKD